MEIQEKILTYLSVYGKENKYRLSRALKTDVSKITNVLSKLREKGKIEIESGNAVLVKGKKPITAKSKKQKVEIKEEQLKEIPKEKPDEHFFVLADGKTLKDLADLADALETMSNKTFKHHVNESKNDFSNWVRDVLKEGELAEEISEAKNRFGTKIAILKKLGGKKPESEKKTEEPEKTKVTGAAEKRGEETSEAETEEKEGERKGEGTVKFFNQNKGFGFITGDDEKEYYFNESGLKEGVTLEADDRVSFKAAESEKGPLAEEVEKITQSLENN